MPQSDGKKILTGTLISLLSASNGAGSVFTLLTIFRFQSLHTSHEGREQNGFNFFFRQDRNLGLYLGESTSKNYNYSNLANDGTGRKQWGNSTGVNASRKEVRLRYCMA